MKIRSGKKVADGSSGGEIVFTIVLLVLSMVAMAFVYTQVALQDGYDKEYISILGEQRVMSQQITKLAGLANRGDTVTFDALKREKARFTALMKKLQEGDQDTGFPGSPAEVVIEMKNTLDIWDEYNTSLDSIIDTQNIIVELGQIVKLINENAPTLDAMTNEAAALMVSNKLPQEQVYEVTQLLMLTQRIVNNANRILEGGVQSVTSADRFARNASRFGQIVRALLEGDRELGIRAVKDKDVVVKLQNLSDEFGIINQQVGEVLTRSPEMFQVSESVQDVIGLSEELLKSITVLEGSYQNYIASRLLNYMTGNLFALVALGMLIFLGVRLKRDGERRIVETESQRQRTEEMNRRSQQAIMRLLDEMGDLADGDLTVNATVTEDITGAIADSMNFTIEALRTLVTSITNTADEVLNSAEATQQTTQNLAAASVAQAEKISSASAAVSDIVSSIEGVSNNAVQLSEESERSVAIAKKGTDTVQKSIKGMDTIREQIQETSKRIKRLGESSQEIGDIVELINDIAEQTNILALNAAIQAAMAGEAGRGFAVVADEVQRLAERSADATKQIEALVKTIQTDTNEAVISMEQSTSEVVAGAKLAEDAGSALVEIEHVSSNLADLILSISNATKDQVSAAANISDTMNSIQEITTQTSHGTTEAANSIGTLAELANEMKNSVSGFKLPQ